MRIQKSFNKSLLFTLHPLLFTFFTLLPAYAICETTPPRLFDAEAHVSFAIPEGWTADPNFPALPLFTWETPDGGQAEINYEPGRPGSKTHLQTELPTHELERYAREDLASRHPHAQLLSAEASSLAGRNAFDVTWVDDGVSGQEQSVYVFAEDRLLMLTLKAEKNVFAEQSLNFQNWLTEVQWLSRHASGALDHPAHGGVWIQHAAGVQISFPPAWLIGVADDRQIGATFAEAENHSEITLTTDLTAPTGRLEVPDKTKREAQDSLAAQGMTVTTETEEPFHSYPAFKLTYEGYRKQRFVKGQDLYVTSPKARWLINIEGDGPLYNRLADDYRKILDAFEFL